MTTFVSTPLRFNKWTASLRACFQASRLRSFIFLLFTLSSSALLAQQGTVTGRITARDSALAGVTVQVKGTSTATQTDEKGNFSISAPANATLVISSVGYVSQEIDVRGHREITVQLQPAANSMNEVVVVGYGTQRKATVTGAVSTVKGAELTKVPAANISNTLAGRATGVITRATGGRPGADNATITIRGAATT
ncbi:MAG: carboxypeptidase-like regulatory domain-containing protein, partial [Flavisolibacter sp.]|nr:carboxypeptidase-like regulatory domain-containing protein [Flavisolibacter sp.]